MRFLFPKAIFLTFINILFVCHYWQWPILIKGLKCYCLCVLRWLMRPILALNCLLQIEHGRSQNHQQSFLPQTSQTTLCSKKRDRGRWKHYEVVHVMLTERAQINLVVWLRPSLWVYIFNSIQRPVMGSRRSWSDCAVPPPPPPPTTPTSRIIYLSYLQLNIDTVRFFLSQPQCEQLSSFNKSWQPVSKHMKTYHHENTPIKFWPP